MDIITLDGEDFPITILIATSFWEVDTLPDMVAEAIISSYKKDVKHSCFAVHARSCEGVKSCVACEEFKLCLRLRVSHITTIPPIPQPVHWQSGVRQTAKKIINKPKQSSLKSNLGLVELSCRKHGYM